MRVKRFQFSRDALPARQVHRSFGNTASLRHSWNGPLTSTAARHGLTCPHSTGERLIHSLPWAGKPGRLKPTTPPVNRATWMRSGTPVAVNLEIPGIAWWGWLFTHPVVRGLSREEI